MDKVYDFIGIGLGPFNLSLACLTQPINELNGLFLDKNSGFDWHPGMMLDGVSLQTPFMSDLVTMADPTHPLSFLNYAKTQGKLYQFYIRESFFLLRQEYNQYCQWACKQLDNIEFNRNVINISFNEAEDIYDIEALNTETNALNNYKTRQIVLGTGPSPYLTPAIESLSKDVIHSSQYMDKRNKLIKSKSITLVGSGQSAAEIYYDLLQNMQTHDYEVTWVTRAPRFFPLEYTKLTLEMTSPEYVDYFYNLPSAKRDQLINKQKHLYKGINASLINDIYDLLYEINLSDKPKTQLFTNAELISKNNQTLSFNHLETEQAFELNSEKLILATGFNYQPPNFLSNLANEINWDNQGRFDVDRFYSIDKRQRIYVQNVELHTHGFVTPDLGMACYRNSEIIKQLTGREIYPIEKRIAFQSFKLPTAKKVTEQREDRVTQ